MAFETEISPVPNQKIYLSIDQGSLIYDDTQVMVAEIVGFSYGTIVNVTNGIKVSTVYNYKVYDNSGDTVAFRNYSLAGTQDNSEQLNTAIIGSFWEYFGNRLLLQIIYAINGGQNIQIGECTLNRQGIHFIQHQTLTSAEKKHDIPWHDLAFQVSEETLTIGSISNQQARKSISLSEVLNAHVFKALCELVQQGRLPVDVLLGNRRP